MSKHGFCIAATHSGAGKTTLTLGLLAALARRGLRVQPFKCGPDYIDPGHHNLALEGRAPARPPAGETRVGGETTSQEFRPPDGGEAPVSRNLDPWMMGEAAVQSCFARASAGADVSVVEGVMGLYDGPYTDRIAGSTAHVAKLLDLPVVLAVDAKAMARSLAAVVKGFVDFEPGVRIVAVIANNVSSASHRQWLEDSLAAAGLPPLIGALPRRREWALPERHLGLIAATESGLDERWFDGLAEGCETHIRIDRLLELCPMMTGGGIEAGAVSAVRAEGVRIALAHDDAFHFYYADNLDLLRRAGAELVPFSPLADRSLPEAIGALLLGGGFPEQFAPALAGNAALREAIRAYAAGGGRIYAECGGLMYLCRELVDAGGRAWPMCGVIEGRTVMGARLNRLGYVEVTTLRDGPLGPAGVTLRGHEFHWSDVEGVAPGSVEALYDVTDARSGSPRASGYGVGNVWAAYQHLHFASCPRAAGRLVRWASGRGPAHGVTPG
jgi:cobyrinic acid a,c-diamide synthase